MEEESKAAGSSGTIVCIIDEENLVFRTKSLIG
jgi:hypothetical protein